MTLRLGAFFLLLTFIQPQAGAMAATAPVSLLADNENLSFEVWREGLGDAEALKRVETTALYLQPKLYLKKPNGKMETVELEPSAATVDFFQKDATASDQFFFFNPKVIYLLSGTLLNQKMKEFGGTGFIELSFLQKIDFFQWGTGFWTVDPLMFRVSFALSEADQGQSRSVPDLKDAMRSGNIHFGSWLSLKVRKDKKNRFFPELADTAGNDPVLRESYVARASLSTVIPVLEEAPAEVLPHLIQTVLEIPPLDARTPEVGTLLDVLAVLLDRTSLPYDRCRYANERALIWNMLSSSKYEEGFALLLESLYEELIFSMQQKKDSGVLVECHRFLLTEILRAVKQSGNPKAMQELQAVRARNLEIFTDPELDALAREIF